MKPFLQISCNFETRARLYKRFYDKVFLVSILRYLYNKMLNERTLYEYLLQLDRDAEDTFNRLVKQMAEREGVTEQLKATNQMAWVGKMNNIRQRATEIVNTELIYT